MLKKIIQLNEVSKNVLSLEEDRVVQEVMAEIEPLLAKKDQKTLLTTFYGLLNKIELLKKGHIQEPTKGNETYTSYTSSLFLLRPLLLG